MTFNFVLSPDAIISSISAFLVLEVAFLVVADNIHSRTNLLFFALCASVVFWIASVMYRFASSDAHNALLGGRLSFGAASLVALSTFFFTGYFLYPAVRRVYGWVIFLTGMLLTVLFTSPYLIANIQFINGEQIDSYGFAYYLFAVYFLVLIGLSVYNLMSKYRRLDAAEKTQVQYILFGFTLSLIVGFITNVVITLTTGITDTAKFGPLAATIFVFVTAVAIIRHRLFNAKIVATELFTFTLWLFLLVRTLLSEDTIDIWINLSMLVLTLVVGILLIRSMLKEVAQRQRIEKLAGDLTTANAQQENLIHFVSHEVKGYLTKSMAAFSILAEDDIKGVPAEVKGLAVEALADNRKGVKAVTDILQASNLKKGSVAYDLKPIDLRETVRLSVADFNSEADTKGLHLSVSIDGIDGLRINGDQEKLREHVFGNLIKNAVAYTPAGDITITLKRNGATAVFSVTDSGVGITNEDKARLFTEGGRGKDSLKVNAHSTGYGLFIAKQIVDAHHGRIFAESEGASKGSCFSVELPLL